MALSKVVKTEKEQRADMLEQLRIVSDEKNIPVEKLVESIEGALVSAYKRAFGGTGTVRVVADYAQSEFRVFASKLVVQKALNPNTEVSWKEAREQDSNVNLGDVMGARGYSRRFWPHCGFDCQAGFDAEIARSRA